MTRNNGPKVMHAGNSPSIRVASNGVLLPAAVKEPVFYPDLSDIKLAENPTTGYRWALTRLPENFYLLSDYYVPDHPMTAGSGGNHYFTFVAVKPKIEGYFDFYLLRSWEPLAPVENSEWDVKVK